MSDTAIQQLEREIKGSPDDAALRLRLATALLRSGRERAALATIDWAYVGPEHFAAAKEIAERVWRERIARFEPTGAPPNDAKSSPGVDRSGRIAVWRTPTFYDVTDLASGELVEREAGKVRRSCAARGAVYFETERRNAHDLRWARVGAGGEIETGTTELGVRSLVDVSPAGDRIVLAEDRTRMMGEPRFYVCALPSLEVLHLGPWSSGGVAVWESERIVFADSVVAWRTGQRSPLAGMSGVAPELLGGSIVHGKDQGVVRIHDVALGWSTTIPVVKYVSLDVDGRTLRASTRARAIIFTLDRATGALEEVDSRSLKGVGLGSWHPAAEILIPSTMHSDRHAISFEGELIREFPRGASPFYFVADGTAVLVMRQPGGSIEVWRERESRG